MWQNSTICNVNSNFPILCNTPDISYQMRPQLQVAMNWFRFIQQIRTIPSSNNPISQLPSIVGCVEKRNKHKPLKLLCHQNNNNNNKLPQINEKPTKPKSNPFVYFTNKDKIKSKSNHGNKFLTTFKVTSECYNQLSRIPNRIGPFECKLCGTLYNGAIQLANHRCPQILRIEHRCPDCHKIFNCPANLASHRRWHKPKPRDLQNDHDEEIDSKSLMKSDNPLISFNIESIINIKKCQGISEKRLELKNEITNHSSCHLCSKSLLNIGDFENHMIDHLLNICY